MHGLHPLIVDLTLITVYAAITTIVFKKLKQPMVLGYLLAGILAGPYFNFVPTVTDHANLILWADIGVIFLLFSLGLEFSFKKMLSVGKSAMITAMLNIFLMLFVGQYVGMFLGWSTTDSFFLGSMISMSSTTIIIKAFDDLNIKKQKFTDLVFGVLVIEDIMGILLLVLLPTIAVGKGFNGGVLGLSVLKLLAFLILCFVSGIYIIPTALRRLKDFLNDEMLLLVSIALSLSMVYLAVYFGFSSALGAFIMGSILSETAVIERVERVIKPLKDFFGAVFFVTVGMMVNPQMFVTYAYPIAVITLVVLCGMVIFSTFGFVISGQNLRTAVQCAFSLAQVGEFAFIIATLGMSLGVIDDFVYPIIVAVSVITTFLTPIMIKSAPRAYKILSKLLPARWLAYIDQTSRAGKPASDEEKLWRELFKSSAMRVFLFSFILSAILVFVNHVLRPVAEQWLPNWVARGTDTFVALLLMSPFLKGLIGWNITPSYRTMLTKLPRFKVTAPWGRLKPKAQPENTPVEQEDAIAENVALDADIAEKLASEPQIEKAPLEVAARRTHFMMPPKLKNVWKETGSVKKMFWGANEELARAYSVLWNATSANRLPLLTLISFRLLVVSFFIVAAVHEFLTENPRVIFVLLLFSILLISQSKWLLNQYIKMEHQFLDNLNGDAKPIEENEEK
jgi:CPA2 family monovalent cation:H+ antiporter-2